MATVAAVVAIAVSVWLVSGSPFGRRGGGVAYAATLEPVANATGGASAVHVVLRMLTRPGEDFAYVNLEGNLQRVEGWVVAPRGPMNHGRSRMEKADRVYYFDGMDSVSYHPERKEAFRNQGGSVDLLWLWPAAWVRQVLDRPAAGVTVLAHEESNGTGRLLLREEGAKLAESERPYFLFDFDRETEVEWDLKTRLLTGLKRWVDDQGARRLFSELVSIEYLPSIDDSVFRFELPSDARWGGVRETPSKPPAVGPRDAAVAFFEAAMRGDRATLETYCPSPATVDLLLGRWRPSEIGYVGQPYRSGSYPGVYVPYKVRFGRGVFSSVREFRLAMRNDNPHRRWVEDGGL
jgi:hypothetical protein